METEAEAASDRRDPSASAARNRSTGAVQRIAYRLPFQNRDISCERFSRAQIGTGGSNLATHWYGYSGTAVAGMMNAPTAAVAWHVPPHAPLASVRETPNPLAGPSIAAGGAPEHAEAEIESEIPYEIDQSRLDFVLVVNRTNPHASLRPNVPLRPYPLPPLHRVCSLRSLSPYELPHLRLRPHSKSPFLKRCSGQVDPDDEDLTAEESKVHDAVMRERSHTMHTVFQPFITIVRPIACQRK